MKAREKTVLGLVTYWCSEHRAYMLSKRCAEVRESATRGIKPTVHTPRGQGMASTDVIADLALIPKHRRNCENCPGVVRRSYAEKQRGELS